MVAVICDGYPVDGSEIRQATVEVASLSDPIICKVLYIPVGCLGFLP